MSSPHPLRGDHSRNLCQLDTYGLVVLPPPFCFPDCIYPICLCWSGDYDRVVSAMHCAIPTGGHSISSVPSFGFLPQEENVLCAQLFSRKTGHGRSRICTKIAHSVFLSVRCSPFQPDLPAPLLQAWSCPLLEERLENKACAEPHPF